MLEDLNDNQLLSQAGGEALKIEAAPIKVVVHCSLIWYAHLTFDYIRSQNKRNQLLN